MRKPCVGCTLKHLGAAAVLEHETLHGYPHYAPYMWGHLVQAEEEISAVSMKFADVIRAHRVRSQYDDHSIPFDALIEFAYTLEGVPDGADVVIPAACLAGVSDANGGLDEPGDTRR